MDEIIHFITVKGKEYRISYQCDDDMNYEDDLKEFIKNDFKDSNYVIAFWNDRGYFIA